jgi:hypothetical protein
MVMTVEPAWPALPLDPQKHNSLLFMTENRQFDHFIIIKMILTAAHDSHHSLAGSRRDRKCVSVQTILRRHRLWSNLQPDVKMLPVYDDAGKALIAVEEHKLLDASTVTGGARHVLRCQSARRPDALLSSESGTEDLQRSVSDY